MSGSGVLKLLKIFDLLILIIKQVKKTKQDKARNEIKKDPLDSFDSSFGGMQSDGKSDLQQTDNKQSAKRNAPGIE